ncbi:hypothetical protein PRK78_000110 [Emydomyces testavorans]|uniref:Uncharacterized protein n=1 Tax=Emydomyces testavorans TaxID=2070801 RepID=A0AAF0IFN4_9EURO|nr:hypothetical protein PRK78_000110 [Emydomyces testavorans]
MEVASDPQGFLGDDDIEIDLDVYQDNVGDDDNDVVVEDVSATASNHPDMSEDSHEHSKDEDMVDDDYSAVQIADHGDASHQGEQNQLDQNVFQPDQGTLERGLEDDYEEDIDAPIPGNHDEEGALIGAAAGSLNPYTSVAVDYDEETFAESRHIQYSSIESERAALSPTQEAAPDEVHQQPPEPNAVEEQENLETHLVKDAVDKNYDRTGTEYAEIQSHRSFEEEEEEQEAATAIGSHQTTNQATNVPAQKSETNVEMVQEQAAAEGDVTEATNDVKEEEKDEVKRERSPTQSSTEAEVKGGAESRDLEDYSPLHRVTVLYQENEMSLFPPNEGDPLEMYLLEDEELAHVPLRHLFHAFREVLGSHMTEKNELVLSIDSLYLQLSEIAIQSTEITLSEIVQVYLELSQNDGVENPEPLYVNLTSRSTFDADFASLRAAAQKGKGLSYLSEWEDFSQDRYVDDHNERGAEANLESPDPNLMDGEPKHVDDSEPSVSEESQSEVASVAGAGHPDEGDDTDEVVIEAQLGALQEKRNAVHDIEFLNSKQNESTGKQTVTNISGDNSHDGDYEEESWQSEDSHVLVEVHDDRHNDIAEIPDQSISQPPKDDQTRIESSKTPPQLDGDVSATFLLEDEEHQVSVHASELTTSVDAIDAALTETSKNEETLKVIEESEEEPGEIRLDTFDDIPEHESVEFRDMESASLRSFEQQADYLPEFGDHEEHVSTHIEQDNQPATRESHLNVLDLGVDVFKSPITKPCEHINSKQNMQDADELDILTADLTYEEIQEVAVAEKSQDDFAEWNLTEHDVSDQEGQLLGQDKPNAMKRPRLDDEFNGLETPNPDSKRHRSE